LAWAANNEAEAEAEADGADADVTWPPPDCAAEAWRTCDANDARAATGSAAAADREPAEGSEPGEA
jgi:hypothetical protein